MYLCRHRLYLEVYIKTCQQRLPPEKLSGWLGAALEEGCTFYFLCLLTVRMLDHTYLLPTPKKESNSKY